MSDALRTARIVARRDETSDIATFELVAEIGEPLPDFEAGAHIDVEAAPEVLRQYSLLELLNDRRTYTIGVLRDPKSRGGSLAMHRLRTGEIIRISEP